jgi:XTP/dITP diphosphohydrolase
MNSTLTSQLLIASSNPGKVREIRALLPLNIAVIGLGDLGLPSPEETGATLRENADLKALCAARASGILALADDSGLEVDALAGVPGVRSARFAGEPPDDARNRKALLAALSGIPEERRKARFVCAVTIATPDGIVGTSQGVVKGTILDHERGSRGFGYDSIFLLPDGRTIAELLDEEKNAMSHRSAAIRKILPVLERQLAVTDSRLALK